jgi:hypothetical protein
VQSAFTLNRDGLPQPSREAIVRVAVDDPACGAQSGRRAATERDAVMSIARAAFPLIAMLSLITIVGSPGAAFAAKAKTGFCLPGEVRTCTLGPPPVCSCKPKTSGQVLQRSNAPKKSKTAN